MVKIQTVHTHLLLAGDWVLAENWGFGNERDIRLTWSNYPKPPDSNGECTAAHRSRGSTQSTAKIGRQKECMVQTIEGGASGEAMQLIKDVRCDDGRKTTQGRMCGVKKTKQLT